jgi:hypothetical protein
MNSTKATDDIIECIAAMHIQEQKTPRCNNYFQRTHAVDESSRTAMITWLCQISDALSLNRETVGLATSFLDRFLSSQTKSAEQALNDRHKFQLAAITTFYIAVKINEPVQLRIDLLVKLCRNFYDQHVILSMEKDILFSLEWRISSPTTLDFVRQALALLPSTESCDLEKAEQYVFSSIKDIHFSTIAPSMVGAACVALSLQESSISTSLDESMLWDRIFKTLELDRSTEFAIIQQRLREKSSGSRKITNIGGRAITTLHKGSSYVNLGEASSPVAINESV